MRFILPFKGLPFGPSKSAISDTEKRKRLVYETQLKAAEMVDDQYITHLWNSKDHNKIKNICNEYILTNNLVGYISVTMMFRYISNGFKTNTKEQ